jgi:hypothetical protein
MPEPTIREVLELLAAALQEFTVHPSGHITLTGDGAEVAGALKTAHEYLGTTLPAPAPPLPGPVGREALDLLREFVARPPTIFDYQRTENTQCAFCHAVEEYLGQGNYHTPHDLQCALVRAEALLARATEATP